MDPTTPIRPGISPHPQAIKPPERRQAEEFESLLLGQMVDEMFKSTGGTMMSGGYAEDTWRSVLSQEYAKSLAATGTTGIADSVERAIKSYGAMK